MPPTAVPIATPSRLGSRGGEVDLAVGHRLAGGDDGELDVAVHAGARRPGRARAAAASKSHSAATRERNAEASNSEIGRVAVRPLVISSQNAFVPGSPGATTPMPVTATRLIARRAATCVRPRPPAQAFAVDWTAVAYADARSTAAAHPAP